MAKEKKSKNQLRREKLRLQKQQLETSKEEPNKAANAAKISSNSPTKTSSLLSIDLTDPTFQQFQNVFQRFQTSEANDSITHNDKELDIVSQGEILEDQSDQETKKVQTISKRQQRKEAKIPLSVLKSSTKHPELVEWYDIDAKDPFFLLNIKASKNVIPVPNHWQLKREYLSTRRDKKPFSLPPAIVATGITEMRDTTAQDDSTSLKEKQRAKVRPKLNSLDLDYQRLYDAFFKHQVKPVLYGFGEVYYEGKEFEEVNVTLYRPGVISQELKAALGVSDGAVLPWVLKMKQMGPPPSYPDLKIPGFNAPLEDLSDVVEIGKDEELGINRELFGKLVSYEEEEEEEEEEQEEETNGDDYGKIEDEDEDTAVVVSEEALRTIDVPLTELEKPKYTPDSDEEDVPLAEEYPIRSTTETSIEPKKLYQILKEKFTDGSKDGLLMNSKSYEINTKRSGDEEIQGGKDAKRQKVTQEEEEKDDDDQEEEEEEEGEKFIF